MTPVRHTAANVRDPAIRACLEELAQPWRPYPDESPGVELSDTQKFHAALDHVLVLPHPGLGLVVFERDIPNGLELLQAWADVHADAVYMNTWSDGCVDFHRRQDHRVVARWEVTLQPWRPADVEVQPDDLRMAGAL